MMVAMFLPLLAGCGGGDRSAGPGLAVDGTVSRAPIVSDAAGKARVFIGFKQQPGPAEEALVHGRGGYDFVNRDSDPKDDNGHGTHCAGIIAAEDNNEGVIGVAPQASLYALKVLNAGGAGSWSDVVAAIQWAADNSLQIASMSLGGPYSSTLEAACNGAYAAGVLLVAAAGNSGNARGTGDNVGYPTRFDSVIAVAATDANDRRAKFSSTGPAVELAAPGVKIYSTLLNGSYGTASGTSMTCPHVSGAAALVKAADLGLTAAEVRTRLDSTARDLGKSGRDPWYGYGLVDAWAAAGQ